MAGHFVFVALRHAGTGGGSLYRDCIEGLCAFMGKCLDLAESGHLLRQQWNQNKGRGEEKKGF